MSRKATALPDGFAYKANAITAEHEGDSAGGHLALLDHEENVPRE
jgi:hypothetical protein